MLPDIIVVSLNSIFIYVIYCILFYLIFEFELNYNYPYNFWMYWNSLELLFLFTLYHNNDINNMIKFAASQHLTIWSDQLNLELYLQVGMYFFLQKQMPEMFNITLKCFWIGGSFRNRWNLSLLTTRTNWVMCIHCLRNASESRDRHPECKQQREPGTYVWLMKWYIQNFDHFCCRAILEWFWTL